MCGGALRRLSLAVCVWPSRPRARERRERDARARARWRGRAPRAKGSPSTLPSGHKQERSKATKGAAEPPTTLGPQRSLPVTPRVRMRACMIIHPPYVAAVTLSRGLTRGINSPTSRVVRRAAAGLVVAPPRPRPGHVASLGARRKDVPVACPTHRATRASWPKPQIARSLPCSSCSSSCSSPIFPEAPRVQRMLGQR